MNRSRGRGRPSKVAVQSAGGGVLRRARDMYGCLHTLASMSGGRARLIEWDEDTFSSLEVELFPDDGLYKGGAFPFKVFLEHDDFKLQYPRDPPVVIFTGSGFLHPNVDPKSGRVCISLLHQDSWNPGKNSMDDVINALMYLMYNPNFGDPLWGSRTSWRYTEKRGKFKDQAQKAMEGGKVRDQVFSPVRTANTEDPLQGRPCVADCEGTGPVKQLALVNKVTSGLVHALGCDPKKGMNATPNKATLLHKSSTFSVLSNDVSSQEAAFIGVAESQKDELMNVQKIFGKPVKFEIPTESAGKDVTMMRSRPSRRCVKQGSQNMTRTKPYPKGKDAAKGAVSTSGNPCKSTAHCSAVMGKDKVFAPPQRLTRSKTVPSSLYSSTL